MTATETNIRIIDRQGTAWADLPPLEGFSFLSVNEEHPFSAILIAYNNAAKALTDKNLSDKHKLVLEKYRLALMDSIYFNITGKSSIPDDELPKTKTFWEKCVHGAKCSLLFFAAMIGLTETAIWTYFGAIEATLTIAPATVAAVTIPVAVLFTTIAIIQFIGFEIGQVKEMLGVKFANSAQEMLSLYTKQIKVAKKINNALLQDMSSPTPLSAEAYREHAKVAVAFNKDIKLKKMTFEEYKEHPAKKALRYGMTFVGMLLMSMEIYLGTTLLLSSFMAPLLGTPLGWAIVGAFVGAYLIFFLSMRGSGLDSLFNPLSDNSKLVGDKLKKFESKSFLDFRPILTYKEQQANQPASTTEQNRATADTSDTATNAASTIANRNTLFANDDQTPLRQRPATGRARSLSFS